MADHTPVDGPHRIHIRRTPSGVEMDSSHFIASLLVALARDFDEDEQGVAEELREIAALDRSARHQGPDSHATHERDAQVDALLDSLGGGSQLVYGPQVAALARSLLAAGQVVAVPTQREAGAA
ncbi:hypothetical protein [Streptomyces hebeiensis]